MQKIGDDRKKNQETGTDKEDTINREDGRDKENFILKSVFHDEVI